jgi:methylthioribose-1-phosphate isomerase
VEPEGLPPTIAWRDGVVQVLDQRRLPDEVVVLELRSVEELCEAIATLAIRGAPALGVAGAMGVALAAVRGEDLDAAAARLVQTRPTAVNLAWGVERARRAADPVAEAGSIAEEDIKRNRRLSAFGAELLADGARVLTHCNAGALACAGYGTALGVIRRAAEAGRRVSVWVDETRPVLQGSRLTAFELGRLGIEATIVADAAAAALMREGLVDCVVVGADRVAANGDVANKIGTYSLAVAAAHHRVPFYVAAPTATIDLACPDGRAIAIEQRPPEELTHLAERRVAPDGARAYNPAFDVTPASLVTALVTEVGVLRPDPAVLERAVEEAARLPPR